ncbi:hypothetical protein BDK51DRAFT_27244, partial [Blyttiomyces helicus]
RTLELPASLDSKRFLHSRATLKWTFAYHLKSDIAAHFFETSQRDLESAVEQLGEPLVGRIWKLLDKPDAAVDIAEIKQLLVDRAETVTRRRDMVLAETARGSREDCLLLYKGCWWREWGRVGLAMDHCKMIITPLNFGL